MTELLPRFDALLCSTSTRFDDPAVAEALVRDYSAYLQRVCSSILLDDQEAQDAVQETLLRVMLNLEKYQPSASIKNWLTTIAVNISRDQLRRRASRQRLQQALHWVGLAARPDPMPEEMLLMNEHSRTLRQAVCLLGEKHRLPLVLRYVHGMPVKEIAQVLGLNEGTVHSRLHYAVRKLQDHLGANIATASDRSEGGRV